MPCIDRVGALPAARPWGVALFAALFVALVAACSSPLPPAAPDAAAGTATSAAVAPETPVTAAPPAPPAPVISLSPSTIAPNANGLPPQPASAGVAVAPRRVPLSPPVAARNWGEFKLQAARRLVQAHPDSSYLGPVPDALLAIPVLEVELNADGSVRRVQVLRHPTQAKDTTQMAIDAVHRAAPYGAMARLPHPWKWVEVFLFDDNRHFKPRELDK